MIQVSQFTFFKPNMYVGLIVLLFSLQVQAVITLPDQCHHTEKENCLVKFEKREEIEIKENIVLVGLADSIVQIENFERLTLNVVKGRIIVKKMKEPFVVNGYKVEKEMTFLSKTKEQFDFLDGRDFYLTEVAENKEQRVLLDRIQFVDYLSKFYDSKKEFKQDIQEISKTYNNSFKKDLLVQKTIMKRSIASEVVTTSDEELKEKKRQEDLKKRKELFFQRTFQR